MHESSTQYKKNSKEKTDLFFKITNDYVSKFCRISSFTKNSLILIFYHELAYFYTTTIARNEILKYRQRKKNASTIKLTEFMDEEIRFGWRNGKSLFEKINKKEKINLKRRILSFIFSLGLKSSNSKKLYIGDLSINNLSIFIRAYLKGYKTRYLENNRVYIDRTDQQIKLFYEYINTIHKQIHIEYDKKKLENDIEYSFSSILTNDITKTPKYSKKDIIIIGSPGKFYNRIASVNAYASGAKVIGVLHADESGSNSLRSWQFDDRSFSHSLIGYGEYGNYYKYKNEIFLSIDKIKQTYIESDSDVVARIYNSNKKIKTLDSNLQQKGLYISLRINENSFLNPEDILDQRDYVEWQKYLLKNNNKLEIKIHPKQKKDFIKYENKKIYGNLIECINDYDYFVLDYAGSTTFSQIAATNKPIIYYDIGLSNFTELGLKYIKNRVIYCKVDINNNYIGFKNYIACDEQKVNFFSEHFSLSKERKSRIDALFSII
jgi:hypothetical protein